MPTPDQLNKVTQYLTAWKRSLLDLSARNRLLHFRKGLSTRVRLDRPGLHDLYMALAVEERSLAFPKPRGLAIDDLELKEVVDPSAHIAPGDLEAAPPVKSLKDLKDLYRKLERLRRGTRTIYEEQGVHTLFLALGLLQWREADYSEEIIDSPLLLVPVRLERNGDGYLLCPHDDDVEVNPALAYRLQRDFGLTLPGLDGYSEEQAPDVAFERLFGDIRDLAAPKSWTVLDEAWLAQFAFYKLPMYRDLEAPGVEESAAMHPVVAALCGLRDRSEPAPVDLKKVEEEHARPELFPVLDADSSQLEVMEQVRQGRTIVVQGPPGTGKSQTIVNLIAQALREGKKVLFVSEKRAALEVVYERLEKLGLARLCLDLHSSRASRKAVVEDLMASLDVLRTWQDRSDRTGFEQYRRLRSRLDEYVHELHRSRDPQGRSAFRVYGTLARLRDVPLVAAQLPFERILDVEPEQEAGVIELLERIARLGVWDHQGSHPWKDAEPSDDFAPIPDAVASVCGELNRVYGSLLALADEMAELTGVRPGTAREVEEHLDLVRHLVKRPLVAIRESWLSGEAEQRASLVRLARELGECMELRRQGLTHLESLGVDPSADADEVRLLYGMLDQAEKGSWYHRLVAEWKVQRRLAKLLRRKLRRREAGDVVRALFAVQYAEAWITANGDRIRTELGLEPAPDRLDRTADAAVEAVVWTASTVEAAGGRLPEALRRAILADDPAAIRARGEALLERAKSALLALGNVTADEHFVRLFPKGVGGYSWHDWPLEKARETSATWEREAGGLPEWLEHLRQMRAAEQAGLSPFLTACQAAGVAARRLPDAFKRAYFTQWLRCVYESSEVLRSFQGYEWEELRRRFQELDQRLQQEAVKATFEVAASRLPDALRTSELTVLSREGNKKRRHLPLRKLFPQIPNLLLAVKRCLMMSPLSVATYLPRQVFSFDLVIFDEASQLLPGDAIGALLRVNQAVIFGDKKQMPPTDFFQAHVEGDDEESDAQDYESILDIASAYFPGPMLKWHYRSRDERLITFSNEHFYGRELVTFPSPRPDGVDTGVSFVYVPEGVYGRGGSRTNVVEARRVAELVLEHCRTRPDLSLGVITMSIEQRDAVEEALRRLMREHPELVLARKEEFFVKNLETVQGDERDVIILDIGYGPSEPGGIPSLQFGPLNRSGGERRLNVAITRARYRMIVVSSMKPEQLKGIVHQARWEGPKLLAEYLEYTQRGGMKAGVYGTGQPESEFEEAVRDALVARGYQVDCQVGISGYRIDLAVRDPDAPGRYVVGIECDGATYHSGRTARDRDRIRQMVLESLGWHIVRVWSTDWIRDPARATDRLVEDIERVRRGEGRAEPAETASVPPAHWASGSSLTSAPASSTGSLRQTPREQPSATAQGSSDATSLVGGEAASEGARFLGFPPYQLFELVAGSVVLARSIAEETPDTLAEVVRQVVQVEGPVHLDQVYERVRMVYGHAKMGRRMRERVERGISLAIRRRWVERRGDFLWRAARETQEVQPRGPSWVARAPHHICPEEWEAAMLAVLRRLGATSRTVAVRHTVTALLGYSRVSSTAREHAESAIERLVAKGHVFEFEGVLHIRHESTSGRADDDRATGWLQ
jgi:very-short-patch-repair endonuclease